MKQFTIGIVYFVGKRHHKKLLALSQLKYKSGSMEVDSLAQQNQKMI